jgi:cyclopropane fatty-acyl-phospholipid synthase-like methyltransferase
MKVKKIKFIKEEIFLDGSLPERDKIVSKIKDVVEQFGILQER